VDLLGHALWAWAGAEVLRRRGRVTKRGVIAGVALSVAPDLVQMVPLSLGLLVGDVTLTDWIAYASARPDTEPILTAWVGTLAHHAHCFMHSLIVLAVVTLALWQLRPTYLYPLLGWWLHVLIDIPTHSADYYPVPIFYPFTYRGVDGIAWISPGIMIASYGALALVALWLYRTRPRRG
jgi:hypothetical protein